jgi:hypothetical protein
MNRIPSYVLDNVIDELNRSWELNLVQVLAIDVAPPVSLRLTTSKEGGARLISPKYPVHPVRRSNTVYATVDFIEGTAMALGYIIAYPSGSTRREGRVTGFSLFILSACPI